MTPGLDYAVGATLFFGAGDLVYKRAAAAGAQPHHLLMVQSWVFLPSIALYGLATGSLTFVAGTLWGALVGLFVMIGFYNFAHSLRSGSISVNAPIFRLSFVITAALAILLLREPLTPCKIAGIALALAAVWMLLGAPAAEDAGRRRESRSSLVRVLVATACVGIGNVIYKYGLLAGATPASLIVAQAGVVVILSTGLVRPHPTHRRGVALCAGRGDRTRLCLRSHGRKSGARRSQRGGADRANGVRRHRGARLCFPARAVHFTQGRRLGRCARGAGESCLRLDVSSLPRASG